MEKTIQAAKTGNTALMQRLISHGARVDVCDPEKWTPLHHAVNGNNVEAVNFLIDNGANVNCRTSEQLTPLHLAAQSNNDILLMALIEAGADIEAQDANGETALHFAVSCESLNCTNFLLEFGASTSVFDKNFFTPLHVAVQTNNYEITELLLKHDASPNNPDSAPGVWSPLHLAVQQNSVDIAKLLIDYGANVCGTSLAKTGRKAERTKTMRKKTGQSSKPPATPLHIAAQYNYPEMMNLLIESGADIKAKDVDNDIPLFISIRTHQIANIEMLCNKEVLKLANKKGQTAYHIASSFGFDDILEELIEIEQKRDEEEEEEEKDEDEVLLVNKPDVEGNTPLHCACIAKSPECVKILLQNGADPAKRNHKKDRTGKNYIKEAGVSPFVVSTGECTILLRKAFNKKMSESGKMGIKPFESSQVGNKTTNNNKTKTLKQKSMTKSFPAPIKTQTITPYKDNEFTKEATSLYELEDQVSKAIGETRDIINCKLDQISEMIESLNQDFKSN